MFRRFKIAATCGLIMTLASSALACGPYKVKPGDTLSDIAIEQVGSFFAFESIYTANRAVIGDNPNLILAGMELNIPCGTSDDTPINWAVLPSAATIARLQQTTDIQILDIRPPTAVANGVIPGAVSVPYSIWRGPQDDPSMIPSAEEISSIVGQAGLKVEKPLLIVHSRPNAMDNGRAALVYWMLKSSGFDTLAILRDGFQGWTNAGLAIADAPVTLPSYDAELLFSSKWRADELDIYGIATAQVTGFLLDARPLRSFLAFADDGQTRVGNTLPTATNAPVFSMADAFSEEVSIEDGVKVVVDHLTRYNADWESGEIVTFCQTGELGALSWFYASELAGLDNMVLYPESVTGWANQGGRLFVGDTIE